VASYNFSQAVATKWSTFGWTVLLGDDTWDVQTGGASGVGRKNTGTTTKNLIVETGSLSSTSQALRLKHNTTGSGLNCGVFCSSNGTDASGYFWFAQSTTVLQVRRINNGTVTTLNASLTVANVNDVQMWARVNGAQVDLEILVGGVSVWTYSDTSGSRLTSGYPGFYNTTTSVSPSVDDVVTTPVGPSTLQSYALDNLIVENGATTGTLIGNCTSQTAGSTFSLSDNWGGRVTINAATGALTLNTNLTLPYATVPYVIVVETLAGATGSPKSTTIRLDLQPVYVAPVTPPSHLWPGASWNGTKTSGGTPPANPTLDLNKQRPGIRLFSLDLQTCIPGQPVDVYVAAFCDGGVAKVEGWCEGRVSTEYAMRRVNFIGDDGTAKTIWCYHFQLHHGDFASDGTAECYFTAYPNKPDADIQVIGPYTFHRASTEFLVTRTVNPGQPITGNNYATIQAALNATTAAGTYPALIQVQQSLTETLNYAVSPTREVDVDKVIRITTATGVAVALNGPNGGYNSNIDVRCNGVEWLGNFTWNRDTYWTINHNKTYPSRTHYRGNRFEGSTQFKLFNGRSVTFLSTPPTTNRETLDRVCFTEPTLFKVPGGFQCFMVRNPIEDTTAQDMFANVQASWGLIARNTDASVHHSHTSVGTISYTGAATTATVSKTAANGSFSGTLLLRENGVTVRTISLGNTPGGGQDTLEWVASQIALQPGWSSTLATQTDPRRAFGAAYLTHASQSAFGAFTDLDCKTAPLAVTVGNDLHIDFTMQHSTAGTPFRNLVHVNPFGANLPDDVKGCQLGLDGVIDLFVINPVTDHAANSSYVWNFGAQSTDTYRNCHLWHLTSPRQSLLIAGNMLLSSFRNGMSRRIDGTQTSFTGSELRNWAYTDASTLPPTTSGLTQDPVLGNMFSDGGAGNGASNLLPKPGGPLTATPRAYAQVPFDNKGNQRAKFSAMGALAALAEYAPPSILPNGSPGIIEGDSNTARGFGTNHMKWAEVALTVLDGRLRLIAGGYPANAGSTIRYTTGGTTELANSMWGRHVDNMARVDAQVPSGTKWFYMHLIGTNGDGNQSGALATLGQIYADVRARSGVVIGVKCFYQKNLGNVAWIDQLNAWIEANADIVITPTFAASANPGDNTHLSDAQQITLGQTVATVLRGIVPESEPWLQGSEILAATSSMTAGFGSFSASGGAVTGVKPANFTAVRVSGTATATLSETTQEGEPAIQVTIAAGGAQTTFEFETVVNGSFAQGAVIDAYANYRIVSSNQATVPFLGLICEGDWPGPSGAAAAIPVADFAGPYAYRTLPIALASAKTSIAHTTRVIVAAGQTLTFVMSHAGLRTAGSVSGSAPVALTAPVMGAATTGSTPSSTAGTYSGTPAPSVVRAYYLEDAVGSGAYNAIADNYSFVTGDIGKRVLVIETASNVAGSTTQTSAPVTVEAGAAPPSVAARPTLTFGYLIAVA